jgi:hypothetical protein
MPLNNPTTVNIPITARTIISNISVAPSVLLW